MLKPEQINSFAQTQVALRQFWQDQMQLERNQHPKRLLRFGAKAYSQNDEDGIIQEIFRRIGTGDRTFVEFGVGAGLECNSLLLLMNGWSGGWMEARPDNTARIAKSHASFLRSEQLRLIQTVVTPETVDRRVNDLVPNGELSLLSIDVDFHDYWIWEGARAARPRVVVIEYNATWPPPLSITVPNDPAVEWRGSNYFGASLTALADLGRRKGYLLVGCCFAGVNAFFVREDLCGDHFFAPGDAYEHYEPARYFMGMLASGHPPGIGPVKQV